MNITVYLPAAIGRWAKDNDLNLSRMLRDAVEAEQDHRQRMEEWAGETAVHRLGVEGDNGDGSYTVRLHAKEIARDGRHRYLYVTQDQRVFVYDSVGHNLFDMRDSNTPREAWESGDPAFYVAIMNALGEEAVIDVGQAS